MTATADFTIFFMGIIGVMAIMIQQSRRPKVKKIRVKSKYRR